MEKCNFSNNSINCLYYGTLHIVNWRPIWSLFVKIGPLPCCGTELLITKAVYFADLSIGKYDSKCYIKEYITSLSLSLTIVYQNRMFNGDTSLPI